MKDIFANQKFDPNKHRPKARYVPDGAENGNQKSKDNGTLERLKKTAMVTFKGDYYVRLSGSSGWGLNGNDQGMSQGNLSPSLRFVGRLIS